MKPRESEKKILEAYSWNTDNVIEIINFISD